MFTALFLDIGLFWVSAKVSFAMLSVVQLHHMQPQLALKHPDVIVHVVLRHHKYVNKVLEAVC